MLKYKIQPKNAIVPPPNLETIVSPRALGNDYQPAKFHRNVTEISSKYRKNVIKMSSKCRQNVIKMSSKGHQNVIKI
jgi:hypothetical protein